MQKNLLVFIMITKLTFVVIKRFCLFSFLEISNHMCVHVNFWYFKIRSFFIKTVLNGRTRTDKIENSTIPLVPTILFVKTPKVWQIPSENNTL